MEKKIINGIVGGRKDSIPIEQIRSLLPPLYLDAKDALKLINNMVESEQYVAPDPVPIDVETGTYVRALQFKSFGVVEFLFNEGTRKEIDQTQGCYSIGEHVYRFNEGLKSKQDIIVYQHNMAIQEVMSCKEDFSLISPLKWIDMLYRKFPGARKNCEDACYNLYDVNGLCKRIEVFRSYVTSGVFEMLTTVSDDFPYTICAVQFSMESYYILTDMISEINIHRFNKLSCVMSNEPLESVLSYVYYIFDIWHSPSQFKHTIVACDGGKGDMDGPISDSMVEFSEFVTDNSSVIVGSYTPIFDAFKSGESYYSMRSTVYSYSQQWYVPHKPWTILNIGFKNSDKIISLVDYSDLSASQRIAVRTEMLMKMVYINVVRNHLLALPKQKEQLMYMREYKNIVEHFFGSVSGWRSIDVMKFPIRLKSKILASDDLDFIGSTKLVVCLAKLDASYWYSENDLHSLGWSEDMIYRAMETEMFVIKRDGNLTSYKKYTPSKSMQSKYINRKGILYEKGISVITEDGQVRSCDTDIKDLSILNVPLSNPYVYQGRDYSKEAPYSINDYHNNLKKDVDSSSSFVFTIGSSIEPNVPASLDDLADIVRNVREREFSSAQVVRKNLNKKKRSRYKRKKDKIVPVVDIEESGFEGDDFLDTLDPSLVVDEEYDNFIFSSLQTAIFQEQDRGNDVVRVINEENLTDRSDDVWDFDWYQSWVSRAARGGYREVDSSWTLDKDTMLFLYDSESGKFSY